MLLLLLMFASSGSRACYFRISPLCLDVQALEFLEELHREVAIQEFIHYDNNESGDIKGIDFARSLLVAAPIHRVDYFLDKAARLPPALADVDITLPEFMSMWQVTHALPQLKVRGGSSLHAARCLRYCLRCMTGPPCPHWACSCVPSGSGRVA